MADSSNSQPKEFPLCLSQDAQGNWYELLSPTQQLTGEIVKKKNERGRGNI